MSSNPETFAKERDLGFSFFIAIQRHILMMGCRHGTWALYCNKHDSTLIFLIKNTKVYICVQEIKVTKETCRQQCLYTFLSFGVQGTYALIAIIFTIFCWVLDVLLYLLGMFIMKYKRLPGISIQFYNIPQSLSVSFLKNCKLNVLFHKLVVQSLGVINVKVTCYLYSRDVRKILFKCLMGSEAQHTGNIFFSVCFLCLFYLV